MKNKKKTINRKRIIARILALSATICVVIALAIPCFALPPTFTVNQMYYDYYLEHYLYIWSTNSSFETLYNAYQLGSVLNADTNKGLFACEYLYACAFDDDSVTNLGLYHYLEEDSILRFTLRPEFLVIQLHDLRDASDYYFNSDDCEVDIEVRDLGANGLVIMTFYDVSTSQEFVVYYVGAIEDDTYQLTLQQVDYQVAGVVQRSFYGIEMQDVGLFNCSLTLRNGYPEDSLALSVLASIIGGSDNIFNRVYTPFSWACGFTTGMRGEEGSANWEEGYAFGKEEGLIQGRQEGYEIGFEDGYQVGYDDGSQTIEGTESYERGYNDAVEQISDGDFGRNLLGGIFSAPLDALGQFTIVSWTTQDGTTINITLGAVISAALGVLVVIWFLKMFAGG